MTADLVKTALRVLHCYTEHTPPADEDVRALRQAASGPEAEWEPDFLATYIIERELKSKHNGRHG
jgi:hypothetical protein